jgi:pilus assembly protein CpaC
MDSKGRVGRLDQVGRRGRVGRAGCSWAAILLIALAGSWPVAASDVLTVSLMVGRSTVIDTGSAIQRVSLTSDDVADALVTSSAQVLVHGKAPGTISMFVWDRAGAIRRYDVTVARDLSVLATQVRDLFPGEHITIGGNGRSIVVAGMVSSKFVADKAVEVAAGYVAKKEDVVNMLQVQDAGASDQVLLQVRFAEVSRSAITELGSSFFTGAAGYKDVLARSTTGQFAAPDFDNSDPAKPKLVFSDFLNLFLFDTKHQLGTVIKALQTRGQFQSLAEPNLVSESGKEASFLAGGEFPVPIAQGSGVNAAITVQYKEFGVRLNFTPVIRGTRVHLKVRPEVSTLDFANGVVLQGFRIPALSTRRTETELELEDGQTFAIAGLLTNQMNSTLRKIPGIGDIPILGLLFQSKAAQKEQTELVVMITPHILPRNSSGVSATLPRTPEPFLPPLPLKKSVEPQPPAFPVAPRRSGDGAALIGPTQGTETVATPAASQPERLTPAGAAGALSALTPKGPVLVQQPAPAAAKTDATAAKPAAQVKHDDTKALERARRDEAKARDAQAQPDRAAAKEAAKQADIQRRTAEQAKKQQEQTAREQAKRDAEASAKAAQAAARQADIEKKQQERQAEIDKKQQKVIDAAAARLSAAEAVYQTEIAKKSQP